MVDFSGEDGVVPIPTVAIQKAFPYKKFVGVVTVNAESEYTFSETGLYIIFSSRFVGDDNSSSSIIRIQYSSDGGSTWVSVLQLDKVGWAILYVNDVNAWRIRNDSTTSGHDICIFKLET